MSVVLHLPYPPSVNAANRFGKKGYYPSENKTVFFQEANKLYMMQARSLGSVKGKFTYHLTLNSELRHGNADGDNRIKYPLDFAQKVGLIENDKLAEGGSWSWGPCEYGALLSIHPVSNRVPEPSPQGV